MSVEGRAEEKGAEPPPEPAQAASPGPEVPGRPWWRRPPPPWLPRAVAAAAGPLLIVAAVLIVAHSYLWGLRFPAEHDVQVEWLPNFCFLGRTLGSGHLPVWNPHVMNGTPFAADPLHGWMNLSAMGLFSTLSCASAIRWYIVLQPILAGLGSYWFLRSEGMSRPASTV